MSSSEQFISKLREAEVHLSQGMAIPTMCKKLGIHQQPLLGRTFPKPALRFLTAER